MEQKREVETKEGYRERVKEREGKRERDGVREIQTIWRGKHQRTIQ